MNASPSRIELQPLAAAMMELNHSFAALLLIVTAAQSISEGHHVAWAAAELSVAVLLIALIARKVMRERKTSIHTTHHGAIEWVEIISGLFLGIEAYARTKGPHHVSFVILAFLPPFMLVMLGAFGSRLRRRRFLEVDGERIVGRLSPFRRFEIALNDIELARSKRKRIDFQLKSGKAKTLRLRMLRNAVQVQEWLEAQLRERGVKVTP